MWTAAVCTFADSGHRAFWSSSPAVGLLFGAVSVHGCMLGLGGLAGRSESAMRRLCGQERFATFRIRLSRGGCSAVSAAGRLVELPQSRGPRPGPPVGRHRPALLLIVLLTLALAELRLRKPNDNDDGHLPRRSLAESMPQDMDPRDPTMSDRRWKRVKKFIAKAVSSAAPATNSTRPA